MKRGLQIAVVCLSVFLVGRSVATDNSWMNRVSENDRNKVNPYSGQPQAIAAGGRMFADHCAQCHGPDALGHGKRPSLRTSEVQSASDGEIFWILRNGYLRRGMPSWSSLPEQTRWQIISYVKSLGVSAENHSDDQVQADKQ
ncbi:MAG: c-type cytochrome [Candidatus Korobacteraceae bacterium]